MAGDTELYDLLGVKPTASSGEIRAAFRKLALTHHPDRGGDEETFTKISRAYETLSDAKARARYDTSGRTAALTVEEELREAFFGGGGLGSSSSTDDKRRTGGNISSEERAKREAAEAERLEARRRLDESERRDAERRARLAGGQASTTSAASNGYHSTTAPARKELAPGDRVELVDLRKTPELMGLTGTLVGSRDGRWQVRLDDGKGDKLIKENNLKKLVSAGTSASSQAKPMASPIESTAKASYSIVGSWTKWTPESMTWDGSRRCFYAIVDLARAGIASFQILKEKDWKCCLHPDQNEASPHVKHRLCGPDDRGHGFNWIIGNHAMDRQLIGSRVEVRLMLRPDSVPDRVEWSKKDELSPGLNGSNGLSAAKGKAVAKSKVAPKVAAAKASAVLKEFDKTPMPPLPGQQYMVAHDQIFVRKNPSLAAEALGTLDRGQYIEAFEETFDGWLRLESDDGSVGWALKDMRGKRGLGKLVLPYGREMKLPVADIADSPGPHKFRVVFKPKVVVRDAPCKDAKMIKIMQFGSEVMAVTQTYTGWIRLANDVGWMLLAEPELGELLSPVFIEEQTQQAGAEATLKEAIANGDLKQLQEAIKNAKAAKVGDASMADAETKLVELHKEQGKRTEMRHRIDAAARNESQLKECLDECLKRSPPWKEESEYAQRLLDYLQSEQEQMAKENKAHLDDLYQATLSGDPLVIKRARDAAKKAGVPMKEIARVYALAQAAREAADTKCQESTTTQDVKEQDTSHPPEVAKEQDTSPYPPEVAKAAVAAAWGLTPEEASLSPEKPNEQLPIVSTSMFDGSWYSKEAGTLAATISGSQLFSPDGEVQALQFCEREIFFEMSGETFRAELDGAGQLVWSDGDVWFRSDTGCLQACPPIGSEGASEQILAAVQASPVDIFDGYWIGAEDEHMATIKGLTIHWADGPPQELERLAEDTVQVELFGTILSARLDSNGHLVWSDGDTWSRVAEPNE